MKKVTITSGQRKKFTKIGSSLLKKHLISGFQLEDFGYNQKKHITYAHDSPSHLRTVKRNVKGKKYPRESYYMWKKSYKLGENTMLIDKGEVAYGKEEYISTNKMSKAKRYFRDKTFSLLSEIPIKGSWDTPDIRIYNAGRKPSNYRRVTMITKRIDKDSRMAMLVTDRKAVRKIKEKLKWEREKKVYIQDYNRASLYDYILEKTT